MDVGSFVQENKRWLLGCATGLVVFFVARSIVGSIYDPGPDRRAARGVVQNAQTSEVYDRSGLAAAIAEQDELQKARAGLESEIGFRRGAEFSFEGKGLSPDEFLGKVGRERKLAILKAASERDVQVDPNRDLTWPQAPNGLDEIRAALFGLELIDETCSRLFAAHDAVKAKDNQAQGLTALKVGVEARRSARRAPVRGQKPGQVDVREFLEQERVLFEFRSDEATAMQFLESLRRKDRTLTLEPGFKMTHTGRRADPVVVSGSVVGIAFKEETKESN
jgi:hypothetical protein